MIRTAMTGERGTLYYKLFKEYMDGPDAPVGQMYGGPLPGSELDQQSPKHRQRIIQGWLTLYYEDISRANRNPKVVTTLMSDKRG